MNLADKKANSLRSNRDFQKVYKHGRRFHSKDFTIYILNNRENKKHSRIGYTLTKKIGNAVIRNKLRRRLKEIIRYYSYKNMSGKDIVIVPKKHTVDMSFEDINNSLLHFLQKIFK